jgi:hypothetical protein
VLVLQFEVPYWIGIVLHALSGSVTVNIDPEALQKRGEALVAGVGARRSPGGRSVATAGIVGHIAQEDHVGLARLDVTVRRVRGQRSWNTQPPSVGVTLCSSPRPWPESVKPAVRTVPEDCPVAVSVKTTPRSLR